MQPVLQTLHNVPRSCVADCLKMIINKSDRMAQVLTKRRDVYGLVYGENGLQAYFFTWYISCFSLSYLYHINLIVNRADIYANINKVQKFSFKKTTTLLEAMEFMAE